MSKEVQQVEDSCQKHENAKVTYSDCTGESLIHCIDRQHPS